MAIRFACQCGKQLQAREELAGRRMRCPVCLTVLHIPQALEVLSPSARTNRLLPWLGSPQEIRERPAPLPPRPTPPPETVAVPAPEPLATDAPAWPFGPLPPGNQDGASAVWVDYSFRQDVTPWPDGRQGRLDDLAGLSFPGLADVAGVCLLTLVVVVLVVAVWLLRVG